MNRYYYNEYGNLEREDTSALRAKGKQIKYQYDTFGRQVKTDNPESEDVTTVYGSVKDGENKRGKVIRVEDESGTIEYEYGKLGEVTEERRTIKRADPYASVEAVMKYESDYLGRMQKITYPDGETVKYGYDGGGNVVSVKGEKKGYQEYTYVEDIGYDEYGQRVYVKYGNGVETKYAYDGHRRWLKNIETKNKWGETYQNMEYRFDVTGNVLGYRNEGNNYETNQNYTYDSLYQLTGAQGYTANREYSADSPSYEATYRQKYEYSSDGLCNMERKESSQSKVLADDLNYELDYEYETGSAHRLSRAGTRYYRYDQSGNLIREQDRDYALTDKEEEIKGAVLSRDEGDGVYSSDYAWAAVKGGSGGSGTYYYR